VTGEETDDLLPMNPEGVEVDDSQVQHGCLSINVHVGQTPLIWFSILVNIGLIYKWIGNLTTYDKYKLWCVFIRDLTITMLATMLATLTTMELYQIEQSLSFGKFVVLVGLFLVAGFIAIALLIGIYLKIIKKLKLKKIDKN